MAMPKLGDSMDYSTFEDILSMDDEEEVREFSSSIVFGFFEQAETTFDDMDNALQEKDLEKLSHLGHFLKGSSATLGLQKMKASCEKIQNWGKEKDATGEKDARSDDCLRNIGGEIPILRKEYKVCETGLKEFYPQGPQ